MVPLSKEEMSARIAKNIAALVEEYANESFSKHRSFVLNLGVGIPTQVSNYLDNDNVFVQAENGMLGVGPIATGEQIHPQLINAGRQPVLETRGCSYLDSSTSFGMIRGGHVDATVLGAFEVDQEANLANWIIPGGQQLGVGGAMDLVSGSQRVIIAMIHTNKGRPKLIKQCTLPITGVHEVDVVVTEMAVFLFENGTITLTRIAPDVTLEEVRAATELSYEVAPELKQMLP